MFMCMPKENFVFTPYKYVLMLCLETKEVAIFLTVKSNVYSLSHLPRLRT